MIEWLARRLVGAPEVTVPASIDGGLRGRAVAIPSHLQTLIGVEPGSTVYVNGMRAVCVDGDEVAVSESVANLVGREELVLARSAAAVIKREWFALSLTTVGMMAVLITLEGDAQRLVGLVTLAGYCGHLFTLRVRPPR